MRAGNVCWDFGAHFGIHTVAMALHVGPSGQVVSLEPDPVAFRRLSYHVRINQLDQVVLLQAAASASTQDAEMIITDGMGSSCSHFRYEDETISPDTRTMTVKRVAMDELVAGHQVRLPDLIKVDVQGHGASALRGSVEAIRQSRPAIVFSNHSPWEIEDTRDLLEPIGYTVHDLEGRPMEWKNVSIPDTVILLHQR